MDITIDVLRQYRSIKHPIYAQNLNNLVVLTGKNGAGKSQLLHIIEGRMYIDATYPQTKASVVINGETINQDDILGIFEWNMPAAPAAGPGDLSGYSQQILSAITNVINGTTLDRGNAAMFSRVQRDELQQIGRQLVEQGFNGRDNQPTIDTIIPMLSASFSTKSSLIINERIASIIYEWHFSAALNGISADADDNPIKIFNALCEEFETGFYLPDLALTEQALRQPYIPKLHNKHGDKIDWNELSSGEQVIFRIICWLFYFRMYQSIYPKLLLLDEPDAHLTPKMIRRLIDSLQSVVVDKMQIAVIMTSHSPNTVALCDEPSLYELVVSADGARSIIDISRNDALRKFSEGLLFVQEDTRLIFVEGKDDLPFYEKLHVISIIRHNLNTVPSLKFIAASVARPEHGGCTKVQEMVPRFEGTSIENIVHGIIDNDNRNVPQQNILVLDRYSIESYLYDPFILLISLVIQDKHRPLISTLSSFNVAEYETLITDTQLRQDAVNEVVAILYEKAASVIDASGFGSDPITIKWLVKTDPGEVTYTLPAWFTRMKKRDIMTKVLRSTGSPFKDIVSEKGQYLALETAGAVPAEILIMFKNIQGNPENNQTE